MGSAIFGFVEAMNTPTASYAGGSRTLEDMLEAGLISGDPSLLTALPGTPLYRRMHLSGRLRNTQHTDMRIFYRKICSELTKEGLT